MNTNRCKLQGHAGYTLIEVLVSIIVFSMIMLFGMSFFTFSDKSFGDAQAITFAISCANSEMERMKTANWDQVVTGAQTVTDTQTRINYTVSRSVQTTWSGGVAYKIINIGVTWPTQKAPVSLVTVRAEH